MGDRKKGEGPYHNNPDKEYAREMDRERTRPKTVADAISYADRIDEVSGENCGLAGKIKRR
jgi:hypothetical protein